MSYTFKIQNLDCANCAAKVESAVKKLEGVSECSVNFFALKMMLTLEGELSDEMTKKIHKAAKKIEPDIKLIASN